MIPSKQNIQSLRSWYNKGLKLIQKFDKDVALLKEFFHHQHIPGSNWSKVLKRSLINRLLSPYKNLPSFLFHSFDRLDTFDEIVDYFYNKIYPDLEVLALKNIVSGFSGLFLYVSPNTFFPPYSPTLFMQTISPQNNTLVFSVSYNSYNGYLESFSLTCINEFFKFLDILYFNISPTAAVSFISFDQNNFYLLKEYKKYPIDYIKKNYLFFKIPIQRYNIESKFYKNGKWVLKFKDSKMFDRVLNALNNIYYLRNSI